jgi:uncharacterized protein (TIGR00661 family)
MAKILYAAAGDGYGHAVRAHAVGQGLLERGHDVQFISCHKTVDYLKPHFPERIHNVFGLLMVCDEGRTAPIRTALSNIRRAATDLAPSNRAVKTLLKTYKPDLVISDFEPFTAMWARRYGIPYISLDNQHLLTHCRLDRPGGFWADLLSAYMIIRLYYGGAKRYLITSFIDAPIRYQPTTLIGPILRSKVYEKQQRDGDYLLAYKSGGDHRAMREQLERFDRLPIRAYGFDQPSHGGNVTYKSFNEAGFLDDLAGCAGVVASAGHSLVSECLHFEKPMLLVPIEKQYEQRINAHHVQEIGVGVTHNRLRTGEMEDFVDRLPTFREKLAKRPKSSRHTVLDAIELEIP